MSVEDQIQQLVKRMELLEQKLSQIKFSEAKEVVMSNCSVGDMVVGNDCKVELQNCSVGVVMDMDDVEDAEDRLDDIESRLVDVNQMLDKVEQRLDGATDAT